MDKITVTQAELLPCPFCGKSDAFVERADYSSCYVFCNECGARGPTSCNESGSMSDDTRRPIRKDEADKIWASIEAEKAERERLMPELGDALRMLGRVSQRFEDLGWREAIYCPKDGSVFEVIEFGSTGIHDCHYDGKWPNGRWYVHDGGDLWPSRPVLFREKSS